MIFKSISGCKLIIDQKENEKFPPSTDILPAKCSNLIPPKWMEGAVSTGMQNMSRFLPSALSVYSLL
jgi:hypothetical protein